jgi:protocatechuate 3,4-dioxygenase beta subunit
MRFASRDRRSFLVKAGLTGTAMVVGPMGIISEAAAKDSFAATKSMRGGSNNYSPNAPLVDNLGTGFFVHGLVRRAGTGEPLPNIRIQIWAATTLGGEREPKNHGSVMTAADGSFRLETMQIVPNFGEPHAHLAYDDSDFKTVFLRPVMQSVNDTSVEANFVLAEA